MLTVPRHFEFLYLAPLAAAEGTVTFTSAFNENKTINSIVNQMVRFMNFV
jgi:hypothetical protein